ncbi:unnamed protein product [Kuraishia capsulata CBS 1993]|uniref:U3 small nucleolar RNA-associated protein 6 N-terminal domain-containing protein n=1 Tax=Kuraishia capsulata CBS 1993 TaxID=1382522 RepID=W6MFU3_9ASCO|nr:uncharacterized protein KUCA_T00000766001 [Kuraishia capsulata CBS 1993]CDK24799.1 unnamed protein product [Kuraishia capsulata CBS 1993]
MSEKVRYYLEQSIPELEDLQRKGLFEKKEITMIMRRRTDFEHRVTGRGTKQADFLNYVEFEKNTEKLRKKRYTRLAKANLIDTKPSISDWASQRRILFVFDRAIRRFPGDNKLWLAYLKYAKANGSVKVIYKIYTKLLQLQPRNVDAWISAAKYEFEQNTNAKGARVLLQKGLRFNSDSQKLWLNYAKFELVYVTKLLARRKLLSLMTEQQQREDAKTEQEATKGDLNDDEIMLPDFEVKDSLNSLPEVDMNMLGNPETNPALRGEIALTIFDIAMKTLVDQVPKDATIVTRESKTLEVANDFLTLFDQFESLDRHNLCGHVIRYLSSELSSNGKVILLEITLPMRYVTITDSAFVDKLQQSVNLLLKYKPRWGRNLQDEVTEGFVAYIQRFTQDTNSERLQKLLQTIVTRCRQA